MGCGNSKDEENKDNKSEQKYPEHSEGGKAPLRYLLPQFTPEDKRPDRYQICSKRQTEYEFKMDPNLPPTLKEVPEEEKTIAVGRQFWDMFGPDGATAKMRVNEALDKLKEKFGDGDQDPFEDYTKVFPGEVEGCKIVVDIPKVSTAWKTDKEFGRQRLTGMNPMGCRKLKDGLESIKEKFPITDEMVEGLTEGKTLKELDEAGKLYYTDYSHYEGIQNNSDLNSKVYVPFCLFFLNSEDDLMPLGVQLYQDPKESPIFTPKHDHDGLWLLVKMAVQQMELSNQHIREHLGGIHFFAEGFYISCRRRLADQHPIMMLMKDCFFATLPLNASAQTLLMGPDGKIPNDFSQGGQGMWTILRRSLVEGPDFNRWVLEEDLKERGMEDIPKYYWRDDARQGYAVWEKFIGKFVDGIYLDDKDVHHDTELQNWAEEIDAVLKYKNMPIKNSQFKSKDDLKFFLTTICWHVTFKHMSIHMTQYPMMSYVPNSPNILRSDLPMDTSATFTESQIRKDYLPEWDDMINSISFYAGVTYPPIDGLAIGEFSEKFVPEGEPGHDWTWDLVAEFKKDLKDMSAKIKKRNEGIDIAYSYMDPENVWRSICV